MSVCPECSSPLKPHPHAGRPRKFCSPECSRASRRSPRGPTNAGRTFPDRAKAIHPPRECLHCSSSFPPSSPTHKFCSSLCALYSKAQCRKCGGPRSLGHSFCHPCGEEVARTRRSTFDSVRDRRVRAGDLTVDEWEAILDFTDGLCVYCGDPWEHRDHVLPLSKGGAHTRTNVVPSCARCNLHKWATDPLDWLRVITEAQTP